MLSQMTGNRKSSGRIRGRVLHLSGRAEGQWKYFVRLHQHKHRLRAMWLLRGTLEFEATIAPINVLHLSLLFSPFLSDLFLLLSESLINTIIPFPRAIPPALE